MVFFLGLFPLLIKKYPAFLHEPCEDFWSFLRNRWSEVIIQDFDWHLVSSDVPIWRFPWSDFPQYNCITKHIGFFSINLSCDDFRGHPLIGAYFASHVIRKGSSPSEIRQFNSESLIQQKVQTLQVSVKNWRVTAVQVVDCPCGFQCHFFTLVPAYLNVMVLQHAPKRTSGTILEENRQVRRFGTGPKEHNNVWMSNSLWLIAIPPLHDTHSKSL